MANWDHVFAYDDDAADWLEAQGYPHPPAWPGGRLPTRAEVERAVAALGLPDPGPLAIELDGDRDSLKVRGDTLLELRLVRSLCEACGPLWLYPDCGSPAIVVDASAAPEELAASWLASLDVEDSWRAFHQQAYGAS